MSMNTSNSDNAHVVSGSSSHRLVHDADTWCLVMQWVEGAIEFPVLCDVLSTRFSEQYIYDDWKALFNRVSEVSEDDAGAGVMAVKAAMLVNTGDGPHPLTSTGSHQAKRQRVASGAQVSREVMDTTSPPRCHKRVQPLICPFKRAAPLVRCFLDVEAQEVDEDGEEMMEEEEEEDPFIVPDGMHEDWATLPSRAPTTQSRIYHYGYGKRWLSPSEVVIFDIHPWDG
ncbi:hypothetical protein HYDPIDRAFT_33071 [Hydnomerulius pinastri MD-312]|uniref:Uncharacterized protein n=1 Tax=Hydnomerulius pinastri MD-312 TaxID=994086 RepID=A0A0C9VPC0_9AGAM|nr:hypothetical protein HYDPIDRAFT_33071 [Hydnomerulius pinastri MD-312]